MIGCQICNSGLQIGENAVLAEEGRLGEINAPLPSNLKSRAEKLAEKYSLSGGTFKGGILTHPNIIESKRDYLAGFTACAELHAGLLEALEKIMNHKSTSIDKIDLIHQCEGYQKFAEVVLEKFLLEMGK